MYRLLSLNPDVANPLSNDDPYFASLERWADLAAMFAVDLMCHKCMDALVAQHDEVASKQSHDVRYDVAIEIVATYLRELYKDTHNLFGN